MTTYTRRFYGKELEDVLGASANAADQANNETHEFKQVLLQQLIPGKYQPRTEFDPDSLQELAHSIAHNGILQPIIVRPTSENNYEIIAGERRWRAAQIANLKTVPVIVYQLSDESALAVSIIENIQRKNLNPIEEAVALQRLIDEFSMTHERVAKLIGRSRTMVTNMLRLLNLADGVKKLLAYNKIEMGHARSLLSLSNQNQQETAELIIKEGLTVRQTEKLVQQYLKKHQLKKSATPINCAHPQLLQWEKMLRTSLATQVKIRTGSSEKGELIISFDNFTQAESLIKHIAFHPSLDDEALK